MTSTGKLLQLIHQLELRGKITEDQKTKLKVLILERDPREGAFSALECYEAMKEGNNDQMDDRKLDELKNSLLCCLKAKESQEISDKEEEEDKKDESLAVYILKLLTSMAFANSKQIFESSTIAKNILNLISKLESMIVDVVQYRIVDCLLSVCITFLIARYPSVSPLIGWLSYDTD